MNIFLFLLLLLAEWVVSTILNLKEAIKSAKVAQGVKETMVTGHQRGGTMGVDLDKQTAVSW